jgi:hypothetical protein
MKYKINSGIINIIPDKMKTFSKPINNTIEPAIAPAPT